MRHPRAGASAVVLKGKVYIMGGFGGSSGQETLNSVEVFNPKDRTWEIAPSMLQSRTEAAAVAHQSRTQAGDGKIQSM